MYACSRNICDALCCCCFSYNALLSLHYESHLAKTATTKKLAQEVGISVREVERHPEADVFLDKFLSWEPGRIHHPFLLWWMFTHMEATRQKEDDHAICQGHWQPLPEQDLSAESTPLSSWASRPPRKKYKGCTMKYTNWKKYLKQNHAIWRWQRISAKKSSTLLEVGPCPAMEEPGQRSTSASRPDPSPSSSKRAHVTYDHFRDLKEESCEEALAVAWDAHRQALAAMAFLKDKIERLSHSISHGHQWMASCRLSGSCRWSHSHWWRSRAVDWHSRESPVSSHHASRRAQYPCLSHFRWQVTFEESLSVGADDSQLLSWADEMVWGDHSDWSQPEPEDLECPHELDPQVQEFWSGEGMLTVIEWEDDPDWPTTPEPSLEDSNKWVLWCTNHVETLSWWPELWEVPNQMAIPQITRRVRASFQMPNVRCHTKKMENDYLAPAALHCIERNVFLPFNTMKFGSQDYHMKQPQKTLAYAKALQHWTKKAQPLMPGEPSQMAECVWELREAMEPLTMFMDDDVLGNDMPSPWVKITSSRTSEAVEPTFSWVCSHSQNWRTNARGSFVVAPSIGQLKPTTITPVVSSSTISSQRVKIPLENSINWQWKPLPGFVEIAKSLWGDNSPSITIEVPPELAAPQAFWQGLPQSQWSLWSYTRCWELPT